MANLGEFYTFLEAIGFVRSNNNYKRTYSRSNVTIRVDEFQDIAYIVISDKKSWTVLKDLYVDLPENDKGKVSMLMGSMMNNGIFDLNDLETLLKEHL